MNQYDYGICPKTGARIVVFQSSALGGYGIARQKGSSNWEYFSANGEWLDDQNISYPTKEEAEKIIDNYCASFSGTMVTNTVVTPVLIDATNGRFAFKCPHCGLVHISKIEAKWNAVAKIISRKCPKHPDREKFNMRMWLTSNADLAAPAGTIESLPDYNCKECFATGQYIGLNKIEPCSTCFPKEN